MGPSLSPLGRGTACAAARVRAEHLRERRLERGVDARHRRLDSERRKRRDAVLADAAGDDAAVMREVGGDVEGDAVIGDPLADADAERCNLVLASPGPGDPDTDAPGPPFAANAKPCEGADQPFLEVV